MRARQRKFRFQEQWLQWKLIFCPVWWRRCSETLPFSVEAASGSVRGCYVSKKSCPKLCAFAQKLLWVAELMNPGFLKSVVSFGLIFWYSKIGKALLETGIHNKPLSCRSFGVWQKNAFPTAVAVDSSGLCSYLGLTAALHHDSALQWMVNALRGKVGSGFFCCCHVAAHDPLLTT